MKNLKRFLAVFVVVTMLAGTMITSFAAAYRYEAEARKLYDLKLYAGVSTTYDPALGDKLTREQGFALICRICGLEEAAKSMSDAEIDANLMIFDDAAKVSGWARGYTAILIRDKIVAGNGTNIDPLENITGRQLARLLLAQGGLNAFLDSSVYELACFKLAELGIITHDEAYRLNNEPLIRDDAVGLMFYTLANGTYTKRSGGNIIGTTPLAKKMIDDGTLTEAQVISAGLTGAFDKENDTLVANAEKAIAEYAAAKLSTTDAEQSALVALQTKAEAEIEKIYDSSKKAATQTKLENAIADKKAAVSPILETSSSTIKADLQSSVLVKLTFLDYNCNPVIDPSLKVQFSTSSQEDATFVRGGDKVKDVVVSANEDGTVGTYLYNIKNQTANKDITVTAKVTSNSVAALKDYTGTTKVTLVPTATVTTPTSNKIVSARATSADTLILTFESDFDFTRLSGQSSNAYYILNSTSNLGINITGTGYTGFDLNASNARIYKVANDAKSIKVVFGPTTGTSVSANKLAPSQTTYVVKYTDSNTGSSIVSTVLFDFKDDVKPELRSVALTGTNTNANRILTFTFSEEVCIGNGVSLTDLNNAIYIDGQSLSAAFGTEATITVTATDRTKVTVTLATGKYFAEGTHEIRIYNTGAFTDTAGNVLDSSVSNTAKYFTVAKETSLPYITDVTALSPNLIKVTFSNFISPGSSLKLRYSADGINYADISEANGGATVDNIKFASDGKTVFIEVNSTVNPALWANTYSAKLLQVYANIGDLQSGITGKVNAAEYAYNFVANSVTASMPTLSASVNPNLTGANPAVSAFTITANMPVNFVAGADTKGIVYVKNEATGAYDDTGMYVTLSIDNTDNLKANIARTSVSASAVTAPAGTSLALEYGKDYIIRINQGTLKSDFGVINGVYDIAFSTKVSTQATFAATATCISANEIKITLNEKASIIDSSYKVWGNVDNYLYEGSALPVNTIISIDPNGYTVTITLPSSSSISFVQNGTLILGNNLSSVEGKTLTFANNAGNSIKLQ